MNLEELFENDCVMACLFENAKKQDALYYEEDTLTEEDFEEVEGFIAFEEIRIRERNEEVI